MQVSADESIYVGDHPENDVKAAERAGMKAVWKIDNYWGQVEADYRIDNLLVLEDILSEI